MDTGPVLATAALPIGPTATAADLFAEMTQACAPPPPPSIPLACSGGGEDDLLRDVCLFGGGSPTFNLFTLNSCLRTLFFPNSLWCDSQKPISTFESIPVYKKTGHFDTLTGKVCLNVDGFTVRQTPRMTTDSALIVFVHSSTNIYMALTLTLLQTQQFPFFPEEDQRRKTSFISPGR